MHDLSGVWQTDITYIQLTNHRWVYLATVLDPEKRKVLGYKISDTMTAELATSAEFNRKCQNYSLKHSFSLKRHLHTNGSVKRFI